MANIEVLVYTAGYYNMFGQKRILGFWWAVCVSP